MKTKEMISKENGMICFGIDTNIYSTAGYTPKILLFGKIIYYLSFGLIDCRRYKYIGTLIETENTHSPIFKTL